jgi:hypothetical protein
MPAGRPFVVPAGTGFRWFTRVAALSVVRALDGEVVDSGPGAVVRLADTDRGTPDETSAVLGPGDLHRLVLVEPGRDVVVNGGETEVGPVVRIDDFEVELPVDQLDVDDGVAVSRAGRPASVDVAAGGLPTGAVEVPEDGWLGRHPSRPLRNLGSGRLPKPNRSSSRSATHTICHSSSLS